MKGVWCFVCWVSWVLFCFLFGLFSWGLSILVNRYVFGDSLAFWVEFGVDVCEFDFIGGSGFECCLVDFLISKFLV